MFGASFPTFDVRIALVNPTESNIRARIHKVHIFIKEPSSGNNISIYIGPQITNPFVYGINYRTGMQSTCYIGYGYEGETPTVVTFINAIFPAVASSGLILDLKGYVLLPGEQLTFESSGGVSIFSITWEEF